MAATWDCRLNRRRKPISDCEDHAKDHIGVKRMMEGHIGTKMRCTNKNMGSSWGKKADGNKDHRGVKRIILGQKGMLRTIPGYYFYTAGCLHQCITSSEKDACAMDQRGQGRTPTSPIVTLRVTWYLHSSPTKRKWSSRSSRTPTSGRGP